ILHEAGHNLGLRHNFKGAVDPRHFHPPAKTTTVMGYSPISTEDLTEPGDYDRAALRVAYGADPVRVKEAIDENYYYCTDEQIFSAQDALCNQYRSGRSLEALLDDHMKWYSGSYVFNNLRLDRVHFGDDPGEYLKLVIRHLVPLRLVFDHA